MWTLDRYLLLNVNIDFNHVWSWSAVLLIDFLLEFRIKYKPTSIKMSIYLEKLNSSETEAAILKLRNISPDTEYIFKEKCFSLNLEASHYCSCWKTFIITMFQLRFYLVNGTYDRLGGWELVWGKMTKTEFNVTRWNQATTMSEIWSKRQLIHAFPFLVWQ